MTNKQLLFTLYQENSERWTLWTDGAIKGTSCVLRGLNDGASYHIRMRSVNRGARSKYYYYNELMTAREILSKEKSHQNIIFSLFLLYYVLSISCLPTVAPGFKMTPELQACVRDGFHINAGSTIRINVPYHVSRRYPL